MWMIIYVAGVLMTATLLLVAFLRDQSIPLTCYRSWLLLVVASVIWPISLPLAGLELWDTRHGVPSAIGTESQKTAPRPEHDSTLDNSTLDK